MEMLKNMKSTLVAQAQSQMGNLQNTDTKELGEVIDMIKDLEEAIYYCTIVKAMEEKDDKQSMYYTMPRIDYARDVDKNYGKMYYDGNSVGVGGNDNRSFVEYKYPRYYQDGNRQSAGESRNYLEREYAPFEMRDSREGRSPISRKSYMESKEMHHDKTKKIQELEKYMQELSTDVVEMIDGASPEEKQMLHNKLTALTSKIEQL